MVNSKILPGTNQTQKGLQVHIVHNGAGSHQMEVPEKIKNIVNIAEKFDPKIIVRKNNENC